MHKLNLFVKLKRKYKNTTDSNHSLTVAENILQRQFNPKAVNKSWGADITYIPIKNNFVYLSIVIDFYSRKVIGWNLSASMHAKNVVQALEMAIKMRNPRPGLIHHSDRGVQYASSTYQSFLKKHQVTPSMSRKGNCWDNAPVERFFATLKSQWIKKRIYDNIEQARQDISEFINMYYNSVRTHSALNGMTPMEFEKSA